MKGGMKMKNGMSMDDGDDHEFYQKCKSMVTHVNSATRPSFFRSATPQHMDKKTEQFDARPYRSVILFTIKAP